MYCQEIIKKILPIKPHMELSNEPGKTVVKEVVLSLFKHRFFFKSYITLVRTEKENIHETH